MRISKKWVTAEQRNLCYRLQTLCDVLNWVGGSQQSREPKKPFKIKFTSNKGVRLDAEVSGQRLLL